MDYTLTGNITEAAGWHAVWFDVGEDGLVDEDSVIVEEVACWATCVALVKKKKIFSVCGLVAGEGGLCIAEEDENFRGYAPPGEGDELTKAVGSLISDFNNSVSEAAADNVEGD